VIIRGGEEALREMQKQNRVDFRLCRKGNEKKKIFVKRNFFRKPGKTCLNSYFFLMRSLSG
jgi:hypothetical protein